VCDALAARAAAPFPPQARCGAQGSFNDLQLLLVLNLTIVTVGGLIKHYVVDPAANAKNLTTGMPARGLAPGVCQPARRG